jgi:hypothetical protein
MSAAELLDDVLLEDRIERGTASPEDLERYADLILLRAPEPAGQEPEAPRVRPSPPTSTTAHGLKARVVNLAPLSEQLEHVLERAGQDPRPADTSYFKAALRGHAALRDLLEPYDTPRPAPGTRRVSSKPTDK